MNNKRENFQGKSVFMAVNCEFLRKKQKSAIVFDNFFYIDSADVQGTAFMTIIITPGVETIRDGSIVSHKY